MNKSDRQGDFFDEYKPEETALVVNEGVEQPPIINPYLSRIINKRKSRPAMTVDDYMKWIIDGNKIDDKFFDYAMPLMMDKMPDYAILR